MEENDRESNIWKEYISLEAMKIIKSQDIAIQKFYVCKSIFLNGEVF